MAVTVNHNRFYVKVLSMFCCVVLLLGFVKPPRGKAVATEAVILSAAATAFVVSCGYTFITGDTGVSDDAFVSSINSMVDNFSLEKFGKSAIDFVTSTSLMSGIHLGDGKVTMNNKAAEYFSDFTHWLQDTFNPVSGGDAVPCSFVKCGSVPIGTYDSSTHTYVSGSPSYTLAFNMSDIVFPSGAYLHFVQFDDTRGHLRLYDSSGEQITALCWVKSGYHFGFAVDSSDASICYILAYNLNNVRLQPDTSFSTDVLGDLVFHGVKVLAGDVHYPQAKEMEKDEELAIAVPALEGKSDLADAINKAAAAGALAATHEITKAGEIADTGEIKDVKDLGLPSLSVAFTTRFPFSIPWDVARGIKLLAAPPKAPYWKVDFMKPLSAEVGGFKGSTAIEIDMSEYEIIGQVSRWTSTIGFCLMLAMGTKKISWIG